MEPLIAIFDKIIETLQANTAGDSAYKTKIEDSITALSYARSFFVDETTPPVPPTQQNQLIPNLLTANILDPVTLNFLKHTIQNIDTADPAGFERMLNSFMEKLIKSLAESYHLGFVSKLAPTGMIIWAAKKFFIKGRLGIKTPIEGNTYPELLKNLLTQLVIEPLEYLVQAKKQEQQQEERIQSIEKLKTQEQQITRKIEEQTDERDRIIDEAITEAQRLLGLCQADLTSGTSTKDNFTPLKLTIDRIHALVKTKIDSEHPSLTTCKTQIEEFLSKVSALTTKKSTQSISTTEILAFISETEEILASVNVTTLTKDLKTLKNSLLKDLEKPLIESLEKHFSSDLIALESTFPDFDIKKLNTIKASFSDAFTASLPHEIADSLSEDNRRILFENAEKSFFERINQTLSIDLANSLSGTKNSLLQKITESFPENIRQQSEGNKQIFLDSITPTLAQKIEENLPADLKQNLPSDIKQLLIEKLKVSILEGLKESLKPPRGIFSRVISWTGDALASVTYRPIFAGIAYAARSTYNWMFSSNTSSQLDALLSNLTHTLDPIVTKANTTIASGTRIMQRLETLKQQSENLGQLKTLKEIGQSLDDLKKELDNYNRGFKKIFVFFGRLFNTKEYKRYSDSQTKIKEALEKHEALAHPSTTPDSRPTSTDESRREIAALKDSVATIERNFWYKKKTTPVSSPSQTPTLIEKAHL